MTFFPHHYITLSECVMLWDYFGNVWVVWERVPVLGWTQCLPHQSSPGWSPWSHPSGQPCQYCYGDGGQGSDRRETPWNSKWRETLYKGWDRGRERENPKGIKKKEKAERERMDSNWRGNGNGKGKGKNGKGGRGQWGGDLGGGTGAAPALFT